MIGSGLQRLHAIDVLNAIQGDSHGHGHILGSDIQGDNIAFLSRRNKEVVVEQDEAQVLLSKVECLVLTKLVAYVPLCLYDIPRKRINDESSTTKRHK